MANALTVAGVAERHVPTSVAVQDRAWVAPADPPEPEDPVQECPAAPEGQAEECPAVSQGPAAVDCRAAVATAFVRLNQRLVPLNHRRDPAAVHFRRSVERRDRKCPTYRIQDFRVRTQAAFSGRRPTFRAPEIPIWVRARRFRFPDRSDQPRDHHFPTPASTAQVFRTPQSGRKHCRAVRQRTSIVQTYLSGRKHCRAVRQRTLIVQTYLSGRKHCRAVRRQTSHARVFPSDHKHCRADRQQALPVRVFPIVPDSRTVRDIPIVQAETIGFAQVIPTAPSSATALSTMIDPSSTIVQAARSSAAVIWALVVETSISTTTLTIGLATRTGVGTPDGITDGITVGITVGTAGGIVHRGTTAIGICIGGQAGIDQCQTIMSAGGLDLGQPIRRL